jgi:hypothetical protein
MARSTIPRSKRYKDINQSYYVIAVSSMAFVSRRR